MARRGKTKIGGSKQEMLRAGEAGQRAEQRAREQTSAAEERKWGRVSGKIQAGFAGISAEGARQEELEQRQSKVAGREQQAGEQMDLQAAGQGLERDPEFAQREAALKEEMARGERQAIAPGELEGSRFVPTERAKEIEERKLGIAESRIDLMRRNAEARASKALGRGDLDGYKESRKNYAAHMKSTIKLADKITRGDVMTLTPSEKGEIKKWAEKNPDPALKQEIESGVYGQRTAQLIRGKAFSDSLSFLALRGDFPDPDLIPYNNPKYREFVSVYIPQAADWLKQRQQIAPIVGITSTEDAERLIRQAAAIAMLTTQRMSSMRQQLQTQGAQDSPELPTPSVNPNAPAPPPAGEQGQPPQPWEQPPGQTGGPVPQPGGWSQQQ